MDLHLFKFWEIIFIILQFEEKVMMIINQSSNNFFYQIKFLNIWRKIIEKVKNNKSSKKSPDSISKISTADRGQRDHYFDIVYLFH